MGVGVDFFSPSIYYYRTFFLSSQSFQVSLETNPMEFPKRSLAPAPEALEKNPLQFPTRSLAPPAAARVFPVSPRTPAKKKREKTSLLLPSTLAAQLLQKKKTRMHWSDVVKKHAVLIHNISIRVDRFHAGIKEVPRHDLDLETSFVDNITTQRNYCDHELLLPRCSNIHLIISED